MTLPGYGIGELTAVIAMIAMFAGGETVQRHEPLRTVLGCVHGLAVITGLVWGLGQVSYSPAFMETVFCLGNVLNFVVVGAMLSIFYPERSDNGSTLPLWETTLGPFLFAGSWSLLSVLAFGQSLEGWSLLLPPTLFLAIHYYFSSGILILMLLFSPPPRAPAASLSLQQRLKSGFGIFWLLLMTLWWGQAPFLILQHWHVLFDSSLPKAISALLFSGLAIFRSARYGHLRISGMDKKA